MPPVPLAVIETAPAEVIFPIVRFPAPSLKVIPLAAPLWLKVTVPPKLLLALARVMGAAPAVMELVPLIVNAPVWLTAPPFELTVKFPPTVPAPRFMAPVDVAVRFPVGMVRVPSVRAFTSVIATLKAPALARLTAPPKLLEAVVKVMAWPPVAVLVVKLETPPTVIPSVVWVIAPARTVPAVMVKALATEIAPSRTLSISVKLNDPDPVIVAANSSTSLAPVSETVPPSVIESTPTRIRLVPPPANWLVPAVIDPVEPLIRFT